MIRTEPSRARARGEGEKVSEQSPRRGVRLNQIAAAIGASPAYLAQMFRVVEGVSLYRYALRLRLMRALELLPQYDDLSGLALDAGFSNHSHFTTAFRQSFGYAPASVRSQMRVRLATLTDDLGRTFSGICKRPRRVVSARARPFEPAPTASRSSTRQTG